MPAKRQPSNAAAAAAAIAAAAAAAAGGGVRCSPSKQNDCCVIPKPAQKRP